MRAGRIALLLLALTAVIVAFAPGWNGPSEAVHADAAIHAYRCPMHPEVHSEQPGECPICRMALEPLTPGHAPGEQSAMEPGSSLSLAPNATALRGYDLTNVVKRHVFSLELEVPARVDPDGSLTAVLYNDEVQALKPEETATWSPNAGQPMDLSLRHQPGAEIPWDLSTSKVRFEVAAVPEATPKPAAGSSGRLAFSRRRHGVLVVPHEAVLQFGNAPYVLASSPDGLTFTKRRVTLGRVQYDMAAVTSGLELHERIAIKNAFFLDAERRIGTNETSLSGASP